MSPRSLLLAIKVTLAAEKTTVDHHPLLRPVPKGPAKAAQSQQPRLARIPSADSLQAPWHIVTREHTIRASQTLAAGKTTLCHRSKSMTKPVMIVTDPLPTTRPGDNFRIGSRS